MNIKCEYALTNHLISIYQFSIILYWCKNNFNVQYKRFIFYKTAYNVIALIIYYGFKRYATANHREGTQQIYALFITTVVFAISATSDRRCTFQLTRK